MASLYLGSTKIDNGQYELTVEPTKPLLNYITINIPASVKCLCNNMFSMSPRNMSAPGLTLKFAGNPPMLGTTPFNSADVEIYYPSSNTAWTDTVKDNWRNNGGANSIYFYTY